MNILKKIINFYKLITRPIPSRQTLEFVQNQLEKKLNEERGIILSENEFWILYRIIHDGGYCSLYEVPEIHKNDSGQHYQYNKIIYKNEHQLNNINEIYEQFKKEYLYIN